MSDDSQHTYSAREIVLEFFPGTDKALVPQEPSHRVARQGDGLTIQDLQTGTRITFTPVGTAGKATTQLCCDICERSAARHYLQTLRAELPGSQGRRFRYISVCRDTQGCAVRRLGDRTLRGLLERILGP